MCLLFIAGWTWPELDSDLPTLVLNCCSVPGVSDNTVQALCGQNIVSGYFSCPLSNMSVCAQVNGNTELGSGLVH